MKRWLLCCVTIPAMVLLAGCEGQTDSTPSESEPVTPNETAKPASPTADTDTAADDFTLPEVDIAALPMTVQTKIGDARYQARQEPRVANKVGILGMLYYVQGFPQAAVTCFQRTMQLEPESPGWPYLCGRAQEKAGNLDRARQLYEQSLARGDGYVLAHARLGALLMENRPDAAADQFRQLLDKLPDSPDAHLGLGLIALNAGRLDEAEQHIRAVLAKLPTFSAAHAALAEVLRAQGDTEAAERHAQRVTTTTENPIPINDPLDDMMLEKGLDPDMLVTAAMVAGDRGDMGRADSLLRIARDIDPDNVAVRNALGALRLNQGRTEDAIELFRGVIADQPDHLRAKTNLALALMRTDQLDEAETLLREVLAAQPVNLTALENFTRLMQMREQPQAALDALNAALEAAPSDALVHYRIGRQLHGLGRPEQAIETLRRAVELRPDFAPAYHDLGRMLYTADKPTEARTAWQSAIKADPTYVPTLRTLLGVYLGNNEYKEAETLLRDALGNLGDSPDRPIFLNALAWILATSPNAEQRNGQEAIELANEACQMANYTNATFLDTLAAAYAEAGQFEEATKWINEAIRLARENRSEAQVAEYEQRQALYAEQQPYHAVAP